MGEHLVSPRSDSGDKELADHLDPSALVVWDSVSGLLFWVPPAPPLSSQKGFFAKGLAIALGGLFAGEASGVAVGQALGNPEIALCIYSAGVYRALVAGRTWQCWDRAENKTGAWYPSRKPTA